MTDEAYNRPLLHTLTTDLEVLNHLLRGELAAMATYEQCINALHDEVITEVLRELLKSHQQRHDQLVTRLNDMGDEPDHTAGLWGTVARIIEGGAALLGDKLALEALEKGELHGLHLYRDLDSKVTGAETRAFIETQLLPEQERTCKELAKLVQAIA